MLLETQSELSALSLNIDGTQISIGLNRAILDCAGEGIYGLDLNGVTTFANPAAVLLTGWTVSEMVGKTQHAQLHHSYPDGSPYPRECCPIYAALHDGQVHHKDDEVFWRKDGTSFPVAYTSTPLKRDGKLVGAVVVFRDITEKKSRERWDRDYRSVLEFVATGSPLKHSLETLIASVHRNQPTCSVTISSRCQNRELKVGRESKRPGDPVVTPCWSKQITSASGGVLGNFHVRLHQDDVGPRPLAPSASEIFEMACGLARIAIEHRNLLDRLAHDSTHDVLTGLANRVLFDDRLEQALAYARKSRTKLGVFFIDLDRFKEVNDLHGHAAGDSFLQQTAELIKSALRDGDTFARMGGDEFAIIVPDLKDESEVTAIANRIREASQTPLIIGGRKLVVSLSLGCSLYPKHGEDALTLQKHADQAMYLAKSTSGFQFEIFDPAASAEAEEGQRMEALLREALDKDWFYLEYQPQFESKGQLSGVEALIRLRKPGEKPIPPSKFIAVAESTGLIVPIGEWVLREACRQGAEWLQKGYAPLSMGVNLSTRQFLGRGIVPVVKSALFDSNFPPQYLDLELTESCIMTTAGDIVQQLEELREMGIQISIDDFGTGYSSLSRLHQLPVNTVKIDKQFIHRLNKGKGGSEIVEAIVALARQLGFRVVAEGVETSRQMDALNKIGSFVVQGFLLGKPEGAEAVQKRLRFTGPLPKFCR